MNPHELNQKILLHHLERKAVVYIRQSSLQQVKQNLESQRLQYALVDRATAFGFHRVEVIDCDLGVSAASGGQERKGFKQLLTSIAWGTWALFSVASSLACLVPIKTGAISWKYVRCLTP